MRPKSGIVVDGSCRPNPGKVEWRGIDLATGQEIFRYGPIPGGTNNIAEFLAIVHALCLTKGTIYSDSQCARQWVMKGRAKTDACTSDKLLNILKRANAKLGTITLAPNQVRFWDQYSWGPNPADFGYKR